MHHVISMHAVMCTHYMFSMIMYHHEDTYVVVHPVHPLESPGYSGIPLNTALSTAHLSASLNGSAASADLGPSDAQCV